MIYDINIVYDVWYMIYDIWCMMYDVNWISRWFPVYSSCSRLSVVGDVPDSLWRPFSRYDSAVVGDLSQWSTGHVSMWTHWLDSCYTLCTYRILLRPTVHSHMIYDIWFMIYDIWYMIYVIWYNIYIHTYIIYRCNKCA